MTSHSRVWVVAAIAAVVDGTDGEMVTEPLSAPVLFSEHGGAAHSPTVFQTHLTGGAEVPPK